MHYVTYVKVYATTPEYVYVGYTPGYLGTVVNPDGVVVYGTGYYYQPWIGTTWVRLARHLGVGLQSGLGAHVRLGLRIWLWMELGLGLFGDRVGWRLWMGGTCGSVGGMSSVLGTVLGPRLPELRRGRQLAFWRLDLHFGKRLPPGRDLAWSA